MKKYKVQEQQATCMVCRQHKNLTDLLPVAVLRPSVAEFIAGRVPDYNAGGYICHADLNRLRQQYVESVMKAERGELTTLEREILSSLTSDDVLERDSDPEYEQNLSFGDRLSDGIAAFGGSWKFIISFGIVLFGWIALNTLVFINHSFDPYPFILLNLVLSCLAALQAPLIMMSQNRQEERDRVRAIHDYKVNLKAELEIRNLHEKMDYLLRHQWQYLMEIQQVQMDLMEELAKGRTNGKE